MRRLLFLAACLFALCAEPALATPTWIPAGEFGAQPRGVDFDSVGDAHVLANDGAAAGYRHRERLAGDGTTWLFGGDEDSVFSSPGEEFVAFDADLDGDVIAVSQDSLLHVRRRLAVQGASPWVVELETAAESGNASLGTLPDGSAVLAYIEADDDGSRRIVARTRNPAGTWSAPIDVATLTTHYVESMIALLAPDGTVNVAWWAQEVFQTTDGHVYSAVKRPDADAFTAPEQVDTVAFAGENSSRTSLFQLRGGIDGFGNVTLAWGRVDNQAYYPDRTQLNYTVQTAFRPTASDAFAPEQTFALPPDVCHHGTILLAVAAGGTASLYFDTSCLGGDSWLVVMRRAPDGTWGEEETLVRVGPTGQPGAAYMQRIAMHDDGTILVTWYRTYEEGPATVDAAIARPGEPFRLTETFPAEVGGPLIAFDPEGVAFLFTDQGAAWMLDDLGPVITALTAPTAADEDVSTAYSVTATDPSGWNQDATTWSFSKAGQTTIAKTGPSTDVVFPVEGEWQMTLTVYDGYGNPTVKTQKVTVTNTAAVIDVNDRPERWTNVDDIVFTWNIDDLAATTTCELKLGDTVVSTGPCSGGTISYPDRPEGTYTWTIRAEDPAGEHSDRVVTFTVDKTGPAAQITEGPADQAKVTDRDQAFAFSSPSPLAENEPAVTFECRVDSDDEADFDPCTSPAQLEDLALEAHTFEVRAVDAAGNAGPVAKRTFTVVEPPPTVAPSTNAQPAAQLPPGTVPPEQNVVTATMPRLVPVRSGGRWRVTLKGAAWKKLEALGIKIDPKEIAVAADKASPRSLRTFLRREEDAATAVIKQQPAAGTPLKSIGGGQVPITLTYFDPSKDDVVEQREEDMLESAERRRRRAGRRVPRCDYLLYTQDALDRALKSITPEEARKRLRAADCDYEVLYRRQSVPDAIVNSVKKLKASIQLTVLFPIVSDFVIVVREDPHAKGFERDDLTLAAASNADKSEDWSLTASDKQDSVFVAQVFESRTGRFVSGLPVELRYLDQIAFRGVTDDNGEVVVRARLPEVPNSKGDRVALVARFKGANGRIAEGFRPLEVRQHRNDFITPVHRRMTYSGGRWTGTQEELDAARELLTLVPANLGSGLIGPTARTGTPGRVPAEFNVVQADHTLATVAGETSAIKFDGEPVLVAADTNMLLVSGAKRLPDVKDLTPLGTAASRRLMSIDLARELVKGALRQQGGLLGMVALTMDVRDTAALVAPDAAKAIDATVDTAAANVGLGPMYQTLAASPLAPSVGVASRDAGATVNIAGGKVESLNGTLMTLRTQDGEFVSLRVKEVRDAGGNVIASGGGNVIASGGGNAQGTQEATVTLIDGAQYRVNGVIASGGGNVIASGGGNVIASGGGNFSLVPFDAFDYGGSNFKLEDGQRFVATGSGLFFPLGIIASGGGNVIASGGGNVIASGGGNVIASGGGNIKAEKANDVIASGGGNVIASGGGNVIASGGGNVIASGGGNVVDQNTPKVIASGGGNVMPVGSNVIASGGGNVIQVGAGNVIASGGGNVIASGGGNIIASGGGNVIALGDGNVIASGGGN